MPRVDVHVHIHHEYDRDLHRVLAKIERNTERIMATQDEFNAVLGRIDTATNDIAGDIRDLKDQVATILANAGLSQGEEAGVLAGFDAVAARLEGIAADTENPVPDEEPEEPVDPDA